ncbi:hypothetical protein [Actinokineospora globicatena]|uniref:hypothetical protein n=1 Tax=Actinokineospora globicatena TaxID=103729 RepID=UPI0020A423DF|nr:hypothetical protein [Actinokineospora globicatena]MCP2306706.1 hypothetical protein [Actinokineospora globicatena]GLW82178.1 hypothetical protein Aglo01_66590 [Actinokineospora globicatena]GLW88971.1 hypothetical protein Aglo02_66100 [Actinokineospora globicatena]
MPATVDGEQYALAVFCAAVPGLRTRAVRGFWEDTLEMHVAEVAAGGSAVSACKELKLDPAAAPPPNRDDGTGPRTDWLPVPSLVGGYVCPGKRCARRADRDDDARPPRCAVFDEQMRFVRGG